MLGPQGGHKQGSMKDHEHGLRSCSTWGSWIILSFVGFGREGIVGWLVYLFQGEAMERKYHFFMWLINMVK